MDNYSLLQECLEHDSIKLDVLNTLEKVKKEKVNKVHKYSITTPKEGNKRWQTYVRLENGNRKRISAYSEKLLFNKLYDHYYPKVILTLEILFSEWIERRKSENLSPRTIQRNFDWWNKYYKEDMIVSVPLEKLTIDSIEKYFYRVIKVHNITSKELANMKFIFSNMMKMARKKSYIKENIFNDVDINTYGCKPIVKKADASRVYLSVEKKKLFHELNKDIINNPKCTDSYAIFLLFKLGLRIGEVAALKLNDIDFNTKEIHVHRMETLVENDNGDLRPGIVSYTKKKSPYGDRFLPLSEYDLEIIYSVLKVNEKYNYYDDGFLFLDEVGRTKIREIDNRIRKLCTSAGIEIKSAHDIRRTVASELYSKGVAIQLIRDYLGHSDVKTTWSYIYCQDEKDVVANKIRNSLNDMNGFKRIQKLEKQKTPKAL